MKKQESVLTIEELEERIAPDSNNLPFNNNNHSEIEGMKCQRSAGREGNGGGMHEINYQALKNANNGEG